jgi:hypothetical protein
MSSLVSFGQALLVDGQHFSLIEGAAKTPLRGV